MMPLATAADASQVERIKPFVQGSPCVVVGSAPVSAPVTVDSHEIVIAVNGGISLAPPPDVWFLGSKEQDKPSQRLFMKPLHRQMLDQARGRCASHVVFLRGPKRPTEAYTLKTLQTLSCEVQTWSVLDKPTKRWIEGELCARADETGPCSSGILAAACAFWCGAESVRLVGFSLHAGYHYVAEKRPPSWWRNHVAADTRALMALRATYGARLSGDVLEAVAA